MNVYQSYSIITFTVQSFSEAFPLSQKGLGETLGRIETQFHGKGILKVPVGASRIICNSMEWTIITLSENPALDSSEGSQVFAPVYYTSWPVSFSTPSLSMQNCPFFALFQPFKWQGCRSRLRLAQPWPLPPQACASKVARSFSTGSAW